MAALHGGGTAWWLGGVDKHWRRSMACSIGRSFQKTLNSIQSRQIAEMEALLTARSPIQLTNLGGLFGAGRTLQRSIHSKIWCQEGAAHQRHVLSPCTAHQQPSAGSADNQQRRSVATSPSSKQQAMYGGSSVSASDSAIMVTAKALDLLRSRDHLQHLGEASAVHEELARLLAQHAKVLQLHSGREQLAVTETDELVQAVPSGPVMYEGGVAELPHRAVEAGVSLHLTEEARKQELFDLALAGADLGESSQTVDTGSASRLGQASLRPFPAPPANPLETLALLVHEQPEQPSSSAALSAMLRLDAKEVSSSNIIGPSVQSRRQHSAAMSTQAIAVGDHLELECSSIASGGQVGSHFHKAQDSTAATWKSWHHFQTVNPLRTQKLAKAASNAKQLMHVRWLQGVCKLPNGFTIFCERALPGERLLARVNATKKSFATAHKLEVLRPHSDAVEASCRHFAQGCGGCSLQGLQYANQLAAKQQQVQSPDALLVASRLVVPTCLPFCSIATAALVDGASAQK